MNGLVNDCWWSSLSIHSTLAIHSPFIKHLLSTPVINHLYISHLWTMYEHLSTIEYPRAEYYWSLTFRIIVDDNQPLLTSIEARIQHQQPLFMVKRWRLINHPMWPVGCSCEQGPGLPPSKSLRRFSPFQPSWANKDLPARWQVEVLNIMVSRWRSKMFIINYLMINDD